MSKYVEPELKIFVADLSDIIKTSEGLGWADGGDGSEIDPNQWVTKQ